MAEKISECIRDEAFLLRSTAYGDDHRILSLLTAQNGRVDVIALGAKKSRRRFSTLDFLYCLEVEYQDSRRGGLHRLAHSELAEDFAALRQDYETTVQALGWLRLLLQVVPEGQHIAGVFSLLRGALRRLRAETREVTHLEFLRELLSRLGFHLELERCLRCSSPEAPHYYFSAEAGGLLCPSCRQTSGKSNMTLHQNFSSHRILAEAFRYHLGAKI
ncbi:MAG TPA: DNA repair protein RecO [Deltaproteobacteria bacterium]|nr:DNA repair protein RecO [Deltaproteobacteria bacterium]